MNLWRRVWLLLLASSFVGWAVLEERLLIAWWLLRDLNATMDGLVAAGASDADQLHMLRAQSAAGWQLAASSQIANAWLFATFLLTLAFLRWAPPSAPPTASSRS